MLKFKVQNLKFKILFTFYFLLFTFCLSQPALAAGGTLSLSPATGTFNKGCNFTLDIKVDTGGAQTDGTDAILVYDPTRFTAKTIRSGTIYTDYPGNAIDATAGRITVSGLSSVASAFSGSGTLASVDFVVVDNAPEGASQIKFDFDPNDKAKTTDSNVVERGTVVDILNSVTDGSYTVGTGSCTSTGKGGLIDSSSSAVVATPTPQALAKSGDTENLMVLVASGLALTLFGVLGLARR